MQFFPFSGLKLPEWPLNDIPCGTKFLREFNFADWRFFVLTWKEGNPPTRVTLLEGLPFSIVFPGFVYMRRRVTLGGGLPYLLARVTLLEGTTFCLFKPCKRSR